ncbi:MAG: hypothetical protein ACI39F_05990 [Acutalibacteraceae bacterium]
MKIKKIIDLCKKQKMMILIDDENYDYQWLSDGYGIYPLLGLPKFNLEQLCNTYDISTKQQEKMCLRECLKLPDDYDFSDVSAQDDTPCRREDFGFAFDERSAIPLKNERGICFIDKKYLAPLEDVEEEVGIYTRYDKAGKMYFALKVGYMLYGIATPMKNIITIDFINKLKTLAELCEISLECEDNNVNTIINRDDEDV